MVVPDVALYLARSVQSVGCIAFLVVFFTSSQLLSVVCCVLPMLVALDDSMIMITQSAIANGFGKYDR